MAALIRDIRVEGEPVVLHDGPQPAPARAEGAAARRPGAAPAPAPTGAPPQRMSYPPDGGASRLPLGQAAPVAAPAPVSAPAPAPAAGVATPAPDPRVLEADIRQRLAAEREAMLQAGREEGFKAGRAEAQQAAAQQLQALEQLLGSLRAQLSAGLADQEDLLVEVVFEAVARILGRVAPTREGVHATVRQVLAQVQEREAVELRVSPADLALLQELQPKLARECGARRIDIVGDPRVALGGCLLHSAGGGLDGRLETQLQRLREVLTAARAADAEPGA